MAADAAPPAVHPDGWPDADRHADDLAAIHRVSTLGPGDHGVRLGQWLEVARDLLRARRALILLGSASPFDVERADGGAADAPATVADHRVDLALERQATVASLGGTASPPDGARDLGDGAVVASPLWVSGELAGAVVLVASADRPPYAARTLALVDLVADGIARVLEHRADDTTRSQAAAEQAAFEALVASISTRLIASSAADLDQVIADGLHAIAAFFGADLAFIDELAPDVGVRHRTHRWASPRSAAAELDVDGPGPHEVVPAAVRGLLARAGHLVARRRALRRADDPLAAMLGPGDRASLWVRLGTGSDPAGILGLAWRTSDPPATDELLGPVRFAADSFHGAVRRRRAALLAQDQAAVFESIARNEPVMTSLALVRTLLEHGAPGAEVAILTVGPTGFALVDDDPGGRRAAWFADLPLDLTNPYGQAVVTGEPVQVAAAPTDPRFGPSVVPEPRFAAVSVVPVRSAVGGHTVAVIALLGPEPSTTVLHPSVRAAAVSLVVVAIDRDRDLRRLAHQATHDPLTDVGNRAALLDRLELALARSRRTDRRVAVLFCDLDGFKAVNDRFGHDVGDRMLVEVAARIAGAVRPSDTVARTGGDEFVVVCDDLDDAEQAAAIAARVTEAVEGTPVRLGEVDLGVAVSVGIAVADAVLDHPDRLLHAADLAMYRAKERGRGRASGDDR